jgi:hypothetical protein
MQTAREFLFGKGLTKAPTGRGRFSREANAALDKARKAGTVFSDDASKVEKPKTVKVEKTPKAVAVKPTERYDNAEVRKWARANGHTVGERGRIHVDVINAYLSSTEKADRPEVTGELDVYRATMTGRYPAGTTFKGTYSFKGKDVDLIVSDAAVCQHCKVSLSGHMCQTPSVVNGAGMGFMSVTPIYPKGVGN